MFSNEMSFVCFVFIQFIKNVGCITGQPDQWKGGTLSKWYVFVQVVLFNSFPDITAFIAKDGGGVRKEDGLANQTYDSVVWFNIMNQCIFWELLYNLFTDIIASLSKDGGGDGKAEGLAN